MYIYEQFVDSHVVMTENGRGKVRKIRFSSDDDDGNEEIRDGNRKHCRHVDNDGARKDPPCARVPPAEGVCVYCLSCT